MDHIAVRGNNLSVFSGADGDGTGNRAKQFLGKTNIPKDEKAIKKLKLQHWKAMTDNMMIIESIIREVNKDDFKKLVIV